MDLETRRVYMLEHEKELRTLTNKFWRTTDRDKIFEVLKKDLEVVLTVEHEVIVCGNKNKLLRLPLDSIEAAETIFPFNFESCDLSEDRECDHNFISWTSIIPLSLCPQRILDIVGVFPFIEIEVVVDD